MTKEDIKKVLLENKEVLKKYKVKSIALFGSYVRNEQRKKSDIDFLVEFSAATFDNYMGLLSKLKEIYNYKIDLVNVKALKKRIKPYILQEKEYLETNQTFSESYT